MVGLDYIVRNVLAQLEDPSLKKYQTLLQLAIRGFKEINLFGATVPVAKYIDMMPGKFIPLPADYVKYTKVGLCVNGEIVLLGKDESMCPIKPEENCGPSLSDAIDNIATNDYFSTGYEFLPFWRNGEFVGGAYGLGGGFNSLGYFQEDKANNRIRFTSEVPTGPIVLEYISTGIDIRGEASVPEECVEPLIAWIYWKIAETPKGRKSGYDVGYWKNEWRLQHKKMITFRNQFNVSEYLDSHRGNIHQSIKR